MLHLTSSGYEDIAYPDECLSACVHGNIKEDDDDEGEESGGLEHSDTPPRMVPIKLENQLECDFQYLINTKSNILEPPHLDDFVLSHIWSYLCLGGLNRVSCTSKKMRSLIGLSPMIRSGLLQGGEAKRSIVNLYPLIKSRCIHPISPDGLWEILQSNKCMVCKNAVKGEKNNSVRFARPRLGLKLCWSCLRSTSTVCIRKVGEHFNENIREYCIALDSERTCSNRYGSRRLETDVEWQTSWAKKQNIENTSSDIYSDEVEGTSYFCKDRINYLLAKPLKNRCGEFCGPIVTARHVYSLVKALKGEPTLEGKLLTYNVFLQGKCKAPDTEHFLYKEFEEAYEENILRSLVVEKDRRAKREMISDKWRMKKTTLAMEFVDKIKANINHPNHLELLHYRVDVMFAGGVKHQWLKPKPILMRTRWVNKFLEKYLLKTKTLTNNDIKFIANKLESIVHEERDMFQLDELKSYVEQLDRGNLQDYYPRDTLDEDEFPVFYSLNGQRRRKMKWRMRYSHPYTHEWRHITYS
jgi:hypothetical protein